VALPMVASTMDPKSHEGPWLASLPSRNEKSHPEVEAPPASSISRSAAGSITATDCPSGAPATQPPPADPPVLQVHRDGDGQQEALLGVPDQPAESPPGRAHSAKYPVAAGQNDMPERLQRDAAQGASNGTAPLERRQGGLGAPGAPGRHGHADSGILTVDVK